jgi:PTH1 family peptidyl-tRNA hydrolase
MNESGRVLRPLRKKYGEISVERLVVVHDELDLPVGVMRIKAGGGLAGHNGLKSVAAHIGSNDFLRIRIGIGRPPSGRESVIQWVLSRPSPSDRDLLATVTERAVRGIEAIVADGVERAMTVYNTTK